MRRIRHASGFTALRVEGGILPPEFLQVVASQEAKHQSGPDYGLTKSLSLKDELSRYWRIANDLWSAYADLRQRAGADPLRIGVNDWLVPLLRDVLGYKDLTPCSSVAVGDRRFPITHQALGSAMPLVLTPREFELDRADGRFGEEGRRRSPHDLVQEYLNAEPKCQWGLAANGNRLRLVRDNPSLTRPAFLEADLELIFSEQLYSDFTAFWLVLHSSRLRPIEGKPEACILEQWRRVAHETGQRALEHLRDGVTEALRHLGNGFLQHPRNEELRAAMAAGHVTPQAYFQELLRLVYRLLFLFTVEERGLLHASSASSEQRGIYHEGYSLARLRDRAAHRRHYDQHDDLWRSLLVVVNGLARGAEPLGLAALGGLFSQNQCPNLDAARLPNARLLDAVRSLSFFRTQDGLARINYRNMGTEELGSVYESLLELHPRTDVEARPWEFGFVSDADNNGNRGSDRKLTGSYYTPPSLVNELIKSALEPVMAEAMRQQADNPRAAIVDLKVIDPACGSGHFLLAAARRMAAEIARLDAGADSPDEHLRQHALREVVQHCMYGVDRNPLAVELCRAALWMETVEPGKPLTFLDSHIRCGDSLVGVFGSTMMEDGIPGEAYKPLAGDDPMVCRELKKRNQQSGRSVQVRLFETDAFKEVAASSSRLDTMPEETLADVEAKRGAWQAARDDEMLRSEEERADMYAAAFFALKTASSRNRVPMSEDLGRVRFQLRSRPGLSEAAMDLSNQHRFFHWYLEFPEVIGAGGFDVVLGNPPFLGGLKISTNLGARVLQWLKVTVPRSGGTADLCAYFFRRAYDLLRQGGSLGMLATNTIAEGDTRVTGLQTILEQGGAIVFAVRSMKWPGDANLEVSLVAVYKGGWKGKRELDGQEVPFISPHLESSSRENTETPKRLRHNMDLSFIGSQVLGLGFVLEPPDARILIEQDPNNSDVLYPYLTGEDLNSRPDQSPSRWVINFRDWPLEQAEQYSDCIDIVRSKVKPQRDLVNRARNRDRWWIYAEHRPGLYAAIQRLPRVMVTSRVTQHLCFSFVQTGLVFSEQVVVLALEAGEHLAYLQSSLHDCWARKYSSTLETRLRYSPSDCFETFPLPHPTSSHRASLGDIGERYHELRRKTMRERALGLTQLYNLFHDPSCKDTDLQQLRQLHADMDKSVAAAYGWTDIPLGHDFTGHRPDTRFAISSAARQDLLDRLLSLNLERSAAEK